MPTYVTPWQVVIVALCAAIYLLLSITFAFYGFRFYAIFRQLSQNLSIHMAKRQATVRKLLSITCLFMLFFMVRFVLVVIGIIYNLTACYWWFDPVYYFTCELLAISLMFFVFKAPAARDDRPLDPVTDPEQSPINQPAQGWYSKGVNGRTSAF